MDQKTSQKYIYMDIGLQAVLQRRFRARQELWSSLYIYGEMVIDRREQQ